MRAVRRGVLKLGAVCGADFCWKHDGCSWWLIGGWQRVYDATAEIGAMQATTLGSSSGGIERRTVRREQTRVINENATVCRAWECVEVTDTL